MRILIAPDKFAGTLSAVQAAEAIAGGWQRTCPEDEVDLIPMADGGPGFVDVLRATLGGDLVVADVDDPYGASTAATLLRVGDTIYLESAEAVGLHLTGPDHRDPEHGSSRGVGQLLLLAATTGVRRIVVGLGGTAVNDGGAGMLHALGATSTTADLAGGPAGLAGIADLDLAMARQALAGVELIAACDVDSPLTGLFGATKAFGPQKGIQEDRLIVVDGWLGEFAAVADRKLAAAKGAGAAGGLGYALMVLGATRQSGIGLVAAVTGLADAAAAADVVVTGEGAFDFSSRAGKVPYGVAEIANAALRPCIALAGRVLVGSREMRALGIESAYSLVDLVGEERALTEPADALAELAARVARTWGGRAMRE